MAAPKPEPGDPIPELVESLLVELGEDPDRQGLKATPDRVARAMRELTSGYGVNPRGAGPAPAFTTTYSRWPLSKTTLSTRLSRLRSLPSSGTSISGTR